MQGMKDPTRMTKMEGAADGTDVTPLELELVLAGREARLPSRDKRQIWLGIAAQTMPVPLPPDISRAAPGSQAGVAAAATSGGAGLMAVKATILAVALGGGSIVGVQAWHHRGGPAAPTPGATAPVAPSVMPAQSATPDVPALHPSAASPAAAPRSPATAARKAPQSRLGAEGRVVLDARRDLREGRPDDALRLLDAARTKFPAGTLVQEREALSIEALFRSGQHEAAGRRAAAFLRAYPGSPHVASVKTFARP
jgi:hypothetical protein